MNILRTTDIQAIAKQVAMELSENNDKILNINKVAEILGKTRAAIAKMCERGQLPYHKHHGSLYFSQRELEICLLNK
ncbi:MAG: helix-turn-helix domain-containing protein [Muribaculaceae bacterium]|nr:helix-turn-helix domain-containing protein [Muribaculaceae bacterium]